MIHPLKFMLLFSETPYCGPHCLHDRRVTVTQECWARCRVIPSDASPLPKARSIATIGQSASNSLKYHTPDLNYQHRPLSRLHFSSSSSSFFNTINNTKCKSLEQMLREKKDRRRTGEDEEEGKQKEGGGKTQVENKTTQLVHLCHCKPVKSPCVFVRVRVNKTVFEVGLQHCTVASLRPLLSPCKNVQGDYRKCYRIQS